MYLLLFEVAEHAINIAVIDAEHAPSSFYPGGIYWHYKLTMKTMCEICSNKESLDLSKLTIKTQERRH